MRHKDIVFKLDIDIGKNMKTLVELLETNALIYGEKPLFTFYAGKAEEQSVVTYRGMLNDAKKIASKLKQFTKNQDRVLILLPPGNELMTAFMGCVCSNNIAILHHPPMNKKIINKLYKIAHNAQVVAIISYNAIIEKIKTNEDLETFEDDFSFEWIEYNDFFKDTSEVEYEIPLIQETDTAFLQYTSGSTGNPKGVMVTHGNVIHNLELMKNDFHLKQDTNIVSWLPPYHDMGLIFAHLLTLYSGISGYYISPINFLQHPRKWLEMLTKHAPAFSAAPNFSFDYCVTKIPEEAKEGIDLSNLSVVNGAEPVHINTLERFYEAFKDCGFKKTDFRPSYGLAETTLYITSELSTSGIQYTYYSKEELKKNKAVKVGFEHPHAHPLVSCGCPRADLKIKIVDPDTLQELPERCIGEIWTSSPSTAKGYWQNEEATKSTFQAQIKDDPSGAYYLRTGDFGFYDNKKLHITGRLKDIIIIRGHNYYPQDIEYTIERAHPLIKQTGTAAFPITISGEAESLGIVCEVKTNDAEMYDEICRNVQKAVLEHHELQVQQITLIPSKKIPKTTSGKIQRKQCKSEIETGEIPILFQINHPYPAKSYAANEEFMDSVSAPTSGALLDWLQKWLNNQCLSVVGRLYESNFSDCGIDSIKAAELSATLSDYLNIPMDPTMFWELNTFGDLAEYLSELANQKVK